ncbi:hypothetical protein DY000_02015200 [Brassica cretica]|uniref:Uncharacterized protein n=1 Tax=Brassica cretica TaxID=69181 RepID=A0ABQ7DAA1_BRACR|nr:hypothetical protein DY000_02015200 [Brassica cretica]
MSLNTYPTGHGTMSQCTRSVLLLHPVRPLINQSRHLDPSSKDQVVHPCPRSDHTRPYLNNNTQAQYLWSTPSVHPCYLIKGDHALPQRTSIRSYHILPVLIRSIHGSHPSSLPWNFHETSFCTASAYKAALAMESEVRLTPFSPNHLLGSKSVTTESMSKNP